MGRRWEVSCPPHATYYSDARGFRKQKPELICNESPRLLGVAGRAESIHFIALGLESTGRQRDGAGNPA